MAEGLQDAAIARRAGISVSTVRRHITAIMRAARRRVQVRGRRRRPSPRLDQLTTRKFFRYA